MQRIYARGFTWAESGFDMRRARHHVLRANHRNTTQIAAFVSGIFDGMTAEEDGELPNLSAATQQGRVPIILRGKYDMQANWSLQFIRRNIDLRQDSVAFLKPQGGGFFNRIKGHLNRNNIQFIDITRGSEWPEGNENVALSTFHSAKGLEFDHVFILGLNHENTAHGDSSVDDQLTTLRRLLAVAVARARKTVVIGYKPGEESRLIQFFKTGTFEGFDI